mgnify:CR=1 FL=1
MTLALWCAGALAVGALAGAAGEPLVRRVPWWAGLLDRPPPPDGRRRAALAALWGVGAAATVAALGPSPAAVPAALVVLALGAVAVVDAGTGYVPDALTLPLLWAGLGAAALRIAPAPPPAMAIPGAALGYALPRAAQALHYRLRRRHGLGGGDVKLTAALGAWLGWSGVPALLGLAATLGLAGAAAAALAGRRPAGAPVPFGFFLALAGSVLLLYGPGLRRALPLLFPS